MTIFLLWPLGAPLFLSLQRTQSSSAPGGSLGRPQPSLPEPPSPSCPAVPGGLSRPCPHLLREPQARAGPGEAARTAMPSTLSL